MLPQIVNGGEKMGGKLPDYVKQCKNLGLEPPKAQRPMIQLQNQLSTIKQPLQGQRQGGNCNKKD